VQAERLLAAGWWLRTNGGAVYGSRPWTRPEGVTDDGVPVRFTVGADGALYAILLGTPSTRSVELRDVTVVDSAAVRLLGFEDDVPWSKAGDGIRVELPEIPVASPAPVLRIEPAP
jgi:alpha-L-fucosidase